MRVHYIQHVPYEGLGSIMGWLEARSAQVSSTKTYEGSKFPGVDEFDWLIVMGGSMSANDEADHPWLVQEKRLIAEAIDASRVVIGICLGAQLIASALGGRVYRNVEREIGWFPIERAGAVLPEPYDTFFAKPLEAFHWHGETFDLPPGAIHLARSRACGNQAFLIGDRVIGLQFHLETTRESLRDLIKNGRADLKRGPWIQSEAEMLRSPDARFRRINAVMANLLDHLAQFTP